MVWNPKDWSDTVVTVSDLNRELRDRFLALVGKQAIYVDALGIVPDVSFPCDSPTAITMTAGNPLLTGLGFSGTIDQAAQWKIVLPKQWNGGTIKYRVRWTSPTAGAGDVNFLFKAAAHSDGDSIESAWGTAVGVVDTFQSAKVLHTSPMSSDVTIGGSPADGDSIVFYLSRFATGASDTKAEKVYVIGVEIFINLDTVNDDGTAWTPETWSAVMADSTQLNARVKDKFDAVIGSQTIFIDAMALIPDGFSNAFDAPTAIATTAGNPQIMGCGFSGSADQYGQFRLSLPKQWNAGTITAKFHWTATAAGAGGVVWAFAGQSFTDGDTDIPSGWGTAQVTADTFLSVKTHHITSASPTITIGNSPSKGDHLAFLIYRNATHGSDTKAEKVYLLGIELTITPDTVNDAGDSWSNSSWSNIVYSGSDFDSRISAQMTKFVGLQTLYIDGMSLSADLTNGCDAPATVAHNGAINPMIMGCGFSGSADQYAQFKVAFPKRWNAGTFTYRMHWTSHAAGSGNVQWRIQAVAASDGDSLDAAFGGTVEVTDTFQSVDLHHISPLSVAVPIGGSPVKEDLISFRIWRNATNVSDTKAEKCYLLGVEIFFTPNEVNDA